MLNTKEKIQKKRPTPVAFPEFNLQPWHDILQTPESQEKKC